MMVMLIKGRLIQTLVFRDLEVVASCKEAVSSMEPTQDGLLDCVIPYWDPNETTILGPSRPNSPSWTFRIGWLRKSFCCVPFWHGGRRSIAGPNSFSFNLQQLTWSRVPAMKGTATCLCVRSEGPPRAGAP